MWGVRSVSLVSVAISGHSPPGARTGITTTMTRLWTNGFKGISGILQLGLQVWSVSRLTPVTSK